jgi:hypothetical protein
MRAPPWLFVTTEWHPLTRDVKVQDLTKLYSFSRSRNSMLLFNLKMLHHVHRSS